MSYLSREACEALGSLRRVVATERGGAPAFTEWHALEALRRISLGEAGRLSLSSDLGIGEASARTLLDRLEREGLVVRTKRGRSLTEKGAAVLKALTSITTLRPCSLPQVKEFERCFLTVLPVRPPRELTEVYVIRDELVARGCRLSLIGYLEEGVIDFPGMPCELRSTIISSITVDSPYDEGALIIVPEGCSRELMGAVIQLAYRDCSSVNSPV